MKATFRPALAAMAILVLTACSTTNTGSTTTQPKIEIPAEVASLDSAQVCCQSVSELTFEPIKNLDDIDAEVTTASQVFEFDTGKSFVKAFELPEHNGSLKITLYSVIAKTAFVPQVNLYDREHRLVRTIKAEEFEYKAFRMIWPDRLEIEIFPQHNRLDPKLDEKYMVIYTPADSFGQTTTITHPSKSMAVAYGNQEPNVPDPQIPNNATGELVFAFKGELSGARAPTATDVGTAPSGASEGAAAGAATATAGAAAVQMQPETEAFYLDQIEAAVNQNQIGKAMDLVEEAERAGSTKAREHFIELIK